MATNQLKRINPATLRKDLETYAALQGIGDYTPVNAEYSLTGLNTAKTDKDAKQTAEIQRAAEAKAARDAAVAAEWKFHNLMLGVKDQIKAQFGANSNQVAALGLKKKSEYRTARRTSTLRKNNGTA